MEKEKQIEEMTRLIKLPIENWLEDTGVIPQATTYYAELISCINDSAEVLFNENYRKINENEVVISKEVYEKLLNLECLSGLIWKDGFNEGKKLYCEQIAQMQDIIKYLKKELKEMEKQRDAQAYITEDLIQEKHLWTEQARKETARESLEEFICKLINLKLITTTEDFYYEMLEVKDDLLKEKFGVDLGEEV